MNVIQRKEIGSEFCVGAFPFQAERDCPKWLHYGSDQILTFSGRTAIETVLLDILKESEIKTALLPSWCCSSMLEPFQRLHIRIEFYDVFWEEEHSRLKRQINIHRKANILFLCNYFGYGNHYSKELLKSFKNLGGIIIEDITHSLLQVNPCHTDSDYYVASLRKWGPLVSGGICCKKNGTFASVPRNMPDKEFQLKKTKAMLLKNRYLHGKEAALKEEYMEIFRKCNEEISENYSGCRIDEISMAMLEEWDVLWMRGKRRKNSMRLHSGLKNVGGIEFLYSLKEGDCPIFVPIICKTERERLRQRLVEERIYCPVHWSKPSEKCRSNLYELELSLVCDQRYSEEDMQRICEVIKDEMGRNGKQGAGHLL